MRSFALAILCLLYGFSHYAIAAPFFADAVPVGSISVTLVPTEAVTPGVSQLVTFGVPFPRASLTAAQLGSLRVLKNGVEQPAFVEQLTPWRHRGNAAFDGTSVRVARVQIHNTFAAAAPETVTVSWGGTPRTQNVAGLTAVRQGWHSVNSGSFVAADNVQEPNVYAVLPADWMARGALKLVQDIPFDSGNPPTRDNPAANLAIEHWPGYTEADRAQKNNFYNIINQDDALVSAANQCPYKLDYEPWLYDRSATMFVLYFKSGYFAALREAVRASDFYVKKLNTFGYFSLKDGANNFGDAKYVYDENIAYTYWLTGDDTELAVIPTELAAWDSYNDVWSPARNFWTERHTAFKLLAYQIAYEIYGGTSYANKLATMSATLVDHQNGAGGQIPHPANFVDGGLYHTGIQHDSDWDDASYGGSSWMSVLLTDAMLRVYATSEDVAVAQLIRRMGNFFRATMVHDNFNDYGNAPGDGTLAKARYAMLLDGSDGQINDADTEHSLDVASGLAWGDYFGKMLGQPDPLLHTAADDLYFTYDISVNYWIRPSAPGAAGLPAFRVAPWRKWGWEHRVSAGFAWAMDTPSVALFANGFE